MGEEKKRVYFWRGSNDGQKLRVKGLDPLEPQEVTTLMPWPGEGEPPAGRPPNTVELSEADVDRLNLRALVDAGKLNTRNGPPIRRSRRTEFRNFGV